MGAPLKKIFWAFSPQVDPAGLANWKLQSNRWEAEYAAILTAFSRHPEALDWAAAQADSRFP